MKQMLADEFPQAAFGEAQNSQQVLDHVWGQKWDLILLDINMPGRSGLEVLTEVKSAHPKLPVLILSIYPETSFAVRALKAGAAAYLTKQSAADELITAVKKVMGGGKYITASLAEKLAADLERGEGALHEKLSNRELQVMRMIAMGKMVKEIASEMSISPKTVGTYRTRLHEKTGLMTDVEITRYVLQNKLIE